MFPLAHLLSHSNLSFRSYVSQKTGYLLSDQRSEQLLHFWVYIIKDINIPELRNNLEPKYMDSLHKLFSNFNYIPAPAINENDIELEKKIPWIFKHPDGGIFIPIEIIKTFMKTASVTGKRYFFHRLANMRYSEMQSFAVFVNGIRSKSNMLSIERSPADMALVLYIWFSNLHTGGYAHYPYRGKLLNGPGSFLRENPKRTLPIDLFPIQPEPLWKHLYRFYPHLSRDVIELQSVLKSSGKGFYRSLQMISNPKNEFAEAMRLGYLLPVFPRGALNNDAIDHLKVVTPPEIKFFLKENESHTDKKNNKSRNENGRF